MTIPQTHTHTHTHTAQGPLWCGLEWQDGRKSVQLFGDAGYFRLSVAYQSSGKLKQAMDDRSIHAISTLSAFFHKFICLMLYTRWASLIELKRPLELLISLTCIVQFKSFVLSHHHNTCALVSEVLVSCWCLWKLVTELNRAIKGFSSHNSDFVSNNSEMY